MFNDVNNPNNQNQAAVDDIFAETDKAASAGSGAGATPAANSSGAAMLGVSKTMPNADIETQRVGLNADEMGGGETEKSSSNKWFKIILIVIIAAILLLSGYLVYSKFFQGNQEIVNMPVTPTSPTSSTATPSTSTPTANQVGTAVSLPGGETATSTATVTPEIPGVAPSASTTITVATATPASLIDSDSDGLTDVEEQALGTNPNVIDTDNDGLSDYEEVKIYHTDPLNADTDGDGYSDGVEVKGGYNPNGPGKLLSATSTPKN